MCFLLEGIASIGYISWLPLPRIYPTAPTSGSRSFRFCIIRISYIKDSRRAPLENNLYKCGEPHVPAYLSYLLRWPLFSDDDLQCKNGVIRDVVYLLPEKPTGLLLVLCIFFGWNKTNTLRELFAFQSITTGSRWFMEVVAVINVPTHDPIFVMFMICNRTFIISAFSEPKCGFPAPHSRCACVYFLVHEIQIV